MDVAKQERLGELIETLLEGRADEASALELDRLLLDDPEAQRYYLLRVDLHHSLGWSIGGEATWRAMRRIREAGLAPGRRSGRVWRATAAAALFLALGLPLLFPPSERPAPVAARGPATLLDPADAAWEGSRLRLRNGSARIRFEGGTQALLRGPAVLEAVTADSATLADGSMSVRVLPGLPFHLSAPGLALSTRSSEFGIGVDRGNVRVSVLEGEILATASGDLPQTVRLTREEGLRRDADGTVTANIVGAGFPFPRLGGQLDPRLPSLANGSFEAPRAGPSETLAAAGWVLSVNPRANAENMDIEAGAGATPAGAGTPPAAEGHQWGYLNARTFPDGRRYTTSMHQAVGPLVAGGTYEINLTIGRTAETHYATLVVGLYSGSPDEGPETPLREWIDPVRLSARGSAPVKLLYACPADTPEAGRTLFLRLATGPAARPGLSRILVDDVRLSLRLPQTDGRKSP